MQIKPTMRHHLIPIRAAIIKKITNKSDANNVEKRKPLYITVETAWGFLKKLKIVLPYD